MSQTILRTENLYVSIAGLPICRALDLTIESGQCWAILGRNGAGKTTLLHTLAGLRSPDAGRILLEDTPLATLPRRAIAQRIGVLFQETDATFPGTVLEQALLGRHPWLGRWQWEGPSDHALAVEALRQVDLSALQDRQVGTLSGGERQRLALATLITQVPRLLLLDEPNNHLDLHHQITLLDLLCRQARQHKTAVMMIVHDVNLALRFCSHLLLLFGDGETQQGPALQVATSETLSRLYRQPITRLDGPHGPVFVPQ
ncbi:MAG: ABC transporter ATP-binding protein [Pseudomonadota bacterium]